MQDEHLHGPVGMGRVLDKGTKVVTRRPNEVRCKNLTKVIRQTHISYAWLQWARLLRGGALTVARLEGVMKFSSEKEATRRMNVTRYLVNI